MMLSLIRTRPLGQRQQQQQEPGELEAQQRPPTLLPSRNDLFGAFMPLNTGTNRADQPATAPSAAASVPRVSRRVRLERDANATLFGPSLANYFPASSTAAAAATTTAAQPASSATAATAAAVVAPAGEPATTSAAQPSDGPPPETAEEASSSPNTAGQPQFAPLTQVSSINSATLRRLRLGASGRARGASLSNLSVASLNSPNPQTLSVAFVESPAIGSQLHNLGPSGDAQDYDESATLPTRSAFPTHRRQYTTDSTWSYPGQGRAEDENDADFPDTGKEHADGDIGPLPLADAIQIGTVHRWLQRAAAGGGANLHPKSLPATATRQETTSPPNSTHTTNGEPALDAQSPDDIPMTEFGPHLAAASSIKAGPLSVCTILQSYVNLKRNTFRLTLGPAAARFSISDESDYGTTCTHPTQPTLPANVLPPAPSAPILANPTHILHFEYDCAAPRCAVHVFIRASRKHGSWNQAVSNPAYPDLLAAQASASQNGSLSPIAPPHILGFPILAATTITRRVSDNAVQASVSSATVSSETNHLPLGFAQKRSVALRLDMSLYAPPTFNAPENGAGTESGLQTAGPADQDRSDARTGAADVAAEVDSSALKEESDKAKAKSDKDKAKGDKETLKAAIVVEALDESGNPLSEPNLQTTYLRLTSVPAPAGSAAAVPGSDGKLRVWSAQVEAQEAEIGPHRFQLQELFGLSTRPPPSALAPADTVGNTDAAGGGDAAEGEGEATEIPTEVPSGNPSASNAALGLNSSSTALVSVSGAAPGVGAYMPSAEEGTTGSECLICLTNPPSTLLLPCTHGLCLECAIQLRESVKNARDAERRRGKNPRRKYACPVCRRVYTSLLHLSTADEKHVAQANAHGIV